MLLAGTILGSCADDMEETQSDSFDKTLIVGKWVNTTDSNEHWEYQRMGSDEKGYGVYWDTSEMTYDEAAKGPGLFEYYFNTTGLMRIFWTETSGSYNNPDTQAPFIIDNLTSTSMSYHSSGSYRSYSFSRQ